MNLEKNSFNIKEEDFLEAGVYFGGRRKHPKVIEVYRKRRRINSQPVYYFNLDHVIKKSKEVYNKLFEFSKKNPLGDILFIGSNPGFDEIIKKSAEECNSPYVINRWIGGLITNFSSIRRNITNFSLLKEEISKIDPEKNKKIFHLIRKKIIKRSKFYEGLVNLKKLPIAAFVLHPSKNEVVIRELQRYSIPIIAICDPSYDPDKFDFSISGNSSGMKSVEFLLQKTVVDAIKNGRIESYSEDDKQQNSKDIDNREGDDLDLENIKNDIDKEMEK